MLKTVFLLEDSLQSIIFNDSPKSALPNLLSKHGFTLEVIWGNPYKLYTRITCHNIICDFIPYSVIIIYTYIIP